MAKAEKLSSGKWRCRVFIGKDENGKQVRKSFTADTKKEAEMLAKTYVVDTKVHKKPEKEQMLFRDAMAEYIDNRSNSRSTTTILKYRSMVEGFETINDLPICDIDSSVLMNLVNVLSEDKAPKTVNDYKNLAISVIREKIPTAIFRVNVGRQQEEDEDAISNMPSETQLAALIKYAESPEMIAAIYLGAFCMMREGEVSALQKSDVEGNIITVRRNMKRDLDKKWIPAETKTKKVRKVIAPRFVVDAFLALPGDSIGLTPHAIGCRFKRLCIRLGYENLSFHGLRKFGASQWSLENINTAYIQEAGGWSSDNVMKRVYVKTFSDAQKEAFETMNRKYDQIVNG